MRYLSAAEAAERWGISARSVRSYCAQGRVPGAFRSGKTWSIPEDAPKPRRSNAPQAAPSPLLERLRREREAGMSGGIYHKLQVELAYNSNHMEGSQLSHEQTRLIFETRTVGSEGAAVRVDDIVEASNHFRCVDYVIDHVEQPLTEAMLKELHRMLKSSTSDAAQEWFAVGDYKRIPNEVGGRPTTEPEDVPGAMRELVASYEAHSTHTLEEIVAFHVALERIHPFQDGNGRVGRLVMLKECLRAGIVPFVIADENKLFYYRGLSLWDSEHGWLVDTCLAAQDTFKAWLDYFRIEWEK